MSLLILPLEKVADKQRRPRTNFAQELPWNYRLSSGYRLRGQIVHGCRLLAC